MALVTPLHRPVAASGTEHDASASAAKHEFQNVRDQPIPLRSQDGSGATDAILVKIDVEGHDSKVIDAASGALAKIKPVLLIDIDRRHSSAPHTELFQRVVHHGYHGFFLGDGRLKPLAGFKLNHLPNAAHSPHFGRFDISDFFSLHDRRRKHGQYSKLKLVGIEP